MPKPTPFRPFPRLRNPYPDDLPWNQCGRMSSKISPQDYAYVKGLFPMKVNIMDIIGSNLFKALVDALREIERVTGKPLEQAYEVDHETYAILEALLCNVNFGVAQPKPTVPPTPDLDYISP